MQLRSGATYASMSFKNTSNNQDAATIYLEEISSTIPLKCYNTTK